MACLSSVWWSLYSLILKNWFIYYKYHFTYYTIESEWLQLINSKLSSNQNWFIKNSYKYGNISYMSRIIGIPCIILASICNLGAVLTIISLMNGSFLMLLLSLSLATIPCIPPALFYVFIVCKTPSFNDTFHIHWESKIHSKILLVWAVVFALTNGSVMIDKHAMIFGSPILNALFFLLIYVSTTIIINKNVQNQHPVSKDDNGDATLKKVLSNQDSIHLFMIHLSKEYSMECLLSWIEFTQFQNYIEPQLNMDVPIQSTHLKNVDPTIPSTIPMSEIIETKENIPTNVVCTSVEDEKIYFAKIKAHKIYNKYIKVDSEFEINIHSSHRETVTNILHDLDFLISYYITMDDLCTLFEELKQEMMILLKWSLFRQRDSKYADLLLSLHV